MLLRGSCNSPILCHYSIWLQGFNLFFVCFLFPLVRRHLFWPLSMVYISVIITHILHITNHAGPSVWVAIHALHSGHFFSWDMGTPHDAILVFLWLWVSYILVWQSSILLPCCWGILQGYTLNNANHGALFIPVHPWSHVLYNDVAHRLASST